MPVITTALFWGQKTAQDKSQFLIIFAEWDELSLANMCCEALTH